MNATPIVISSVNVQCLRTKLDVLSFFIEEVKPDILCICEHWITAQEAEYYYSIEYLNLVNGWYRTSAPGGGVSIYANSSLRIKKIDLNSFSVDVDLELTAVELLDLNIIVVSVYHSPKGNFENFLNKMESCLCYLMRMNSKIALCGDFNVHFGENSTKEREFMNIITSYGLFVGSYLPTRGDACLDTVITNLNTWDYKTKVFDPMIADHGVLVVDLYTKQDSNQQAATWHVNYVFTKRVIRKETLGTFQTAVSEIDWQPRLQEMAASNAFEEFFQSIKAKFDYIYPEKIKKYPVSKSQNSQKTVKAKTWYTSELKKIKCIVLLLHDHYKTATDPKEKEFFYKKYLQAKRLYRKDVEEAKKKSNDRFIAGAHNPCKAAWDLINENRKKITSPLNLCSPDDFNNYFIEIVENTVNAIPDVNVDPAAAVTNDNRCTMINWKELQHKEVIKIIKSFKPSDSQDIYGMSINLLKKIMYEIARPLTVVINKCLTAGVFPDFLKLARTVPVYKKGDPGKVENFRPISIIPVFAKVIETAMKNQILEYFETNELFSEAQHGFRKGRSTTTATMDLVNKIKLSFEKRECMALTLCDLSKAFDCIPHTVLLNKLSRYGLGGTVLATLKSYLENRRQIVSVQGALSQELKLHYGVPQGSVMAPLMFLGFVNDISSLGQYLQFADDTTLLSNGINATKAQEEADVLFDTTKNWFTINKMKINEEKTQKLMCSLGDIEDPNGKGAVKLLGFKIDGRLTWQEHTSHVCDKLSRVIYLLRKLKHVITDQYILMVYYSLFHSHISYGLILWGHSAGSKKILLLQKKAIRIISSSRRHEHCKPIFKQLGVMTIFSQYVFQCLMYIKENRETFSSRSDIHSYETRKKGNIDIPSCRLSRTRDSFPAVAIKMFNHLNSELRSLELGKFKRKMSQYLCQKPLYSVSEYFDSETANWVA